MSDLTQLAAARESFTLAEAACAWVGVPLSLGAPGVHISRWAAYPGKLEEWRTFLGELRREAAKGPHGSLNLGAPSVRHRVVKAGKVYEVNLGSGGARLVDGARVEFWIDFDQALASRESLRQYAESRGKVPPFLSSLDADGSPAREADDGEPAKGATAPHGQRTERRVIALLAYLLADKADKWRRPGTELPNASGISEAAAELASHIEDRAREQKLPTKYQGLKATNIRRLIGESLKALRDE